MTAADVVIVGASLGGFRTAQSLRKSGFSGPITLIGSEAHYPYQRPPLSKAVLSGTLPLSRAQLRGEVAQPYDLLLSTTARSLDVHSKIVHLDGDRAVAYDQLVLACGASPTHLPNLDPSPTCIYLRTLDDVQAVRDLLDQGARSVAVIGGGFIGAEVAATSAQLGLEVHLIDLEPALMSRVVGPIASKLLGKLHRSHSVSLHLGASVSSQSQSHNGKLSIRLSDETNLEVDFLVVGVGVRPNTQWLADTPLTIENGVSANEFGQTDGTTSIWAVGDVASWFHPLYGRHLRFEHFENTINQAMRVGKNIMGKEQESLEEIPFGWSDQYEEVIQFLGVPQGGSEEVLLYGDPEDEHGSCILGYHTEGRLQAAFLYNASDHLAEIRTDIETTLKLAE